jgi:hypothetical protein
MPRFVPAALALLALCGAPLPPASAAGPYDEFLKLVPPGANTLVLVNVKAAHASPLAKAEKWADDLQKKYRSGVGAVPANAELVVVAAEVNLTAMTRDHQIALMRLGNSVSIPDLVTREGGTRDDLADQPVVVSPRNVYFAPMPRLMLAAVYPADRQATARWVRHTRAPGGPALTPYLKQAADGAGDAAVVVAADLADVLSPAVVRYGLSVSPVIARQKVGNLDLLARVVASVRGLTLTATVKDSIAATVRVDFALDPSTFKGVLKDLFLELVEEQGVAIAGMEKWEAKFDEKSMTLSGPLLTDDLRRIGSLFAFPSAHGPDAPEVAKDQPSLPMTQRYMAAVDAILTDISKAKDSPNYDKTATWHDKAAAQLENLSRRGVDPIAVEGALESARRLRAIAGSLRGVPIDLNALASKPQYELGGLMVGGGGWGWGRGIFGHWGIGIQSNVSEIQDRMSKVIANDEKKRSEAWSQINQAMGEAKRKLAEKYKTEF